MQVKRLVLAVLGCEFFAVIRLQPGRGMAITLMVALIIKHAMYQYLPISPVHAALLHTAAVMSGLWLVSGLFGMAGIHALAIPRWDSGRRWLGFGTSDKTTLLKVEPIIAFLLVAAAFLAVMPEWGGVSGTGDAFDAFGKTPVVSTARGTVFYPFWHYLGLTPTDDFGRVMTVYGRTLPAWFHDSAPFYAMVLPFLGWLGFAMHCKWVDWPASAEYRNERREATPASSGTLTFTTVEEVK